MDGCLSAKCVIPWWLVIFLKVLLVGVLSAFIITSIVILKGDSLNYCTYRKCEKQYVGSTVTSFRLRFNNHKSSLSRFGKGRKEICGRHLYSHFLRGGSFGNR